MRKLIRRPKAAVAILLMTAVVATPAAVWAHHEYSDVLATHWAHEPVSKIKAAGITNVPPPEYGINDPVTRGQMAAFFDRGLGSATGTSVDTSLTFDDAATATLASVDVKVPGSGGQQIVVVTADFWLEPSTNCPCWVSYALSDGTNLSPVNLAWAEGVGDMISLTWGFPAASGSRTFSLVAQVNSTTTGVDQAITWERRLSARTFPFSAAPATASSAGAEAYESTLTLDDFAAESERRIAAR